MIDDFYELSVFYVLDVLDVFECVWFEVYLVDCDCCFSEFDFLCEVVMLLVFVDESVLFLFGLCDCVLVVVWEEC